MDQVRQRIQDDLRGLVRGDVRCDDLFLQLYASDASIYQIRPLAVVRPRSTADVAAVVQYANEQKLPLHARARGPDWPESRWEAASFLTFPVTCDGFSGRTRTRFACSRASSWRG